jgi:hypothetical protein
MKKNVIRLTESELKNYIRKVVNEQTAQGSNPIEDIKKRLLTKNVNLFADKGESKPMTMVRIDDAVLNGQMLSLTVTDLNFVDDYGNEKAKKGTKVTQVVFTCRRPDYLNVSLMDTASKTKSGGVAFSKKLQGIINEYLKCAGPIKRDEDLASVATKSVENLA